MEEIFQINPITETPAQNTESKLPNMNDDGKGKVSYATIPDDFADLIEDVDELQEDVGVLKQDLDALTDQSIRKIDKPSAMDDNKFPRAKNEDVEWVEFGLPTDEQTAEAVQAWLNAHPEATTTVPNGSIGTEKFVRKLYVANVNVNSSGDASATINSLISEMSDYSTLVIPSGIIRITSPIVITKKITLLCLGKIYAVGCDAFSVQSECTINANAEVATSGKSVFIFTTDNVSRVTITGSYIFRNNFIYINAKGIYNIFCNGAKIKFNRTSDVTDGTVIHAESTVENLCGEFDFIGCIMSGFRRLCYLKDCNTVRFIGCSAESAYVEGETLFVLDNTRNCCFIGNRFIEIINSCAVFLKVLNVCWGLQYFGASYEMRKLDYSGMVFSAGVAAYLKFGNVYNEDAGVYYDNFTVLCSMDGSIHTFATELTEIH